MDHSHKVEITVSATDNVEAVLGAQDLRPELLEPVWRYLGMQAGEHLPNAAPMARLAGGFPNLEVPVRPKE